jgi:hypothetical protein
MPLLIFGRCNEPVHDEAVTDKREMMMELNKTMTFKIFLLYVNC